MCIIFTFYTVPPPPPLSKNMISSVNNICDHVSNDFNLIVRNMFMYMLIEPTYAAFVT